MQYLYIFPGTPVFQNIVLSRCKDTNPSLYSQQLTTANTTVQSSAPHTTKSPLSWRTQTLPVNHCRGGGSSWQEIGPEREQAETSLPLPETLPVHMCKVVPFTWGPTGWQGHCVKMVLCRGRPGWGLGEPQPWPLLLGVHRKGNWRLYSASQSV